MMFGKWNDYYRICDTDGRVKYSKVAKVKCKGTVIQQTRWYLLGCKVWLAVQSILPSGLKASSFSDNTCQNLISC